MKETTFDMIPQKDRQAILDGLSEHRAEALLSYDFQVCMTFELAEDVDLSEEERDLFVFLLPSQVDQKAEFHIKVGDVYTFSQQWTGTNLNARYVSAKYWVVEIEKTIQQGHTHFTLYVTAIVKPFRETLMIIPDR